MVNVQFEMFIFAFRKLKSRTHHMKLTLCIVEVFALLTSIYGLHYTFVLDNGFFGTMHNCIWFIFAILANIFGLAAIFFETWEGRNPTGGFELKTLQALQFHYFFSWMGVLVGYAGLVTQTWMTYYPITFSHVHLALVAVPLLAWLKRKGNMIVVTTQIVTILAILSHAYITMATRNWWSFGGTLLMGLQIIAMSLPVRYTFFTKQFSTHEAAILIGGVSSLVFPRGIAESARYLRAQRKIFV